VLGLSINVDSHITLKQPIRCILKVATNVLKTGLLGKIIITQRFYRELITSLKVIASFFDVSNLTEDDVVSGATDGVEKYFTCLCKAEKKAEAHLNEGNVGKPALEVCERGAKEGIH